MLRIFVGTLLALTAANSIAANMYIYKDKDGKAHLTNVSNPSGNSGKYTKKVKTTYYKAPRNTNTTAVKYSENVKNISSKYTYIQPVPSYKSTNTNHMQSASEFKVPNGYRLPTKADITGDWKTFNAPNHVKADFNGDGIEDEAYLLPKKGSKLGYGVFVSLNKSKAAIQSGRKFQMFKLTDRDDMSPQSFAIELAEPSNEIWKSACGKGYWDCEIGEPSAFKINHPSIMFCYIESACTIYMWDSKILTFKEIIFSD